MSRIVEFHHQGDFTKTIKFLQKLKSKEFYKELNQYGAKGVQALQAATPKRTGMTAASWSYEIEMTSSSVTIYWTNTRMGSDGKTPVAILIQQGHGTRTGGYVQGIDYINPALKPIFQEMADAIWNKVVTS